MNRIALLTICLCVLSLGAFAEGRMDSLRYTIDLRRVRNGKLFVQLDVPALREDSVTFSFPRIVPGTYAVQDFGRFVAQLQVRDAAGRLLRIVKRGRNQWTLPAARGAKTITYWVSDMSRATGMPAVLPMVATVFRKDEHFVLNAPGIFGYFSGYERAPVALHVIKPQELLGSGGTRKVSPSATADRFAFESTYQLYDAPIFYARADTVQLSIAGCAVTIAVCSGNKELSARKFAQWIEPGLRAAGRYLGRVPKREFTFLYFIRSKSDLHALDTSNNNNVLEHAQSTYWYLQESSVDRLQTFIANVSEHEFLHTLTPYSIAPDKLRYFDFQRVDLSGHSWLFEGGAEYLSMHARLKGGLLAQDRFLAALARKIVASRTQFQDSLSIFDVSRNSAGALSGEFPKMYSKGVLLAACLDVYLLHLSEGRVDLKTVILRMKERVEKEASVSDERLMQLMVECSYPEVAVCLAKYVVGAEELPYAEYFGMAGVQAEERTEGGKLLWVLRIGGSRTSAQEQVSSKWLIMEK